MHPNTLAYRLRRFGTLARRDLASTGALAESGWRSMRRARWASPADGLSCLPGLKHERAGRRDAV
ncbi:MULTISPECIES: hypothetical protein [unclassified Streptomyces]|uniref:hypothetical protein n=1 Tax=unclassified Streptomyces TaxID=2593676 RepID=UPI003B632122